MPTENEDRFTELASHALDFVQNFEGVFDVDWEFTKGRICDELFVSESGTFIDAQVSDLCNNWASRGNLLDSYQRLVAAMKSLGVYESEEDHLNKMCENHESKDNHDRRQWACAARTSGS